MTNGTEADYQDIFLLGHRLIYFNGQLPSSALYQATEREGKQRSTPIHALIVLGFVPHPNRWATRFILA
ncbi:hypothetical protein MNBD_GAMMA18-1303 [hydrothermal vent metagenome]|uniref:Uncharacterized protein n=1 Tax=hydrothermal vent metagenome TaxID=652676 RepID=A0A3B0Z3J8_9ZZZZ